MSPALVVILAWVLHRLEAPALVWLTWLGFVVIEAYRLLIRCYIWAVGRG